MAWKSWFRSRTDAPDNAALSTQQTAVRPTPPDESEVSDAVRGIFDDIRRTMEIPFVPNIMRSQAGSDAAMQGIWGAFSNVFLKTNLPLSLASMILYCISADKNCEYCSAVHLATCKSTGMDQDTLRALQTDLTALNPRRSQMCILFAMKCAASPASLSDQDYADLHAEGISDEEVVDIVALAALGNYLDTIADALQLDVDDVFKAAS